MERETLAVIDSSVVVKWFNMEEYSDNAEDIKEMHLKGELTLISPVLMPFEVLNALRYNPEFGIKDVTEAFMDLLGIQIKLYPVEDWMSGSISLAYDLGLTIYDASYLALAKHIGCVLYTADSRLSRVSGVSVMHIAKT